MNSAAEVGLVAQREIRKNLRSAKGIVLLVLSVLGGVLAALLLAWVDKKRREELGDMPPEAVAQLKDQLASKLGEGDPALGTLLADAPTALVFTWKVTVWLGPALVALLGFDAISGELQHRSVRYWTIRTRRASYYVGKVLGLWGVVSALTLFVHILMWGVLIARGESAGSILEWGGRFWLISVPISLVWCALAQLVSSQFKSPILALLMTLGTFFALWMVYVVGATGYLPWAIYVYPNVYDMWLAHPHADRVLEGLGICVGSAAVYLAAGAVLFDQRDV